MTMPVRYALPTFAVAITLAASAAAADTPTPDKVIASINLAKSFATRTPWRFVATQGRDVNIEISDPRDMLPGEIKLCLTKDDGKTCRPDFRHALSINGEVNLYSDPHYLNKMEVVYPWEGGRPFVLLQIASLPSGDGDSLNVTRVLKYDRASDRFIDAYRHLTGHNNNQEIRYMASGPLRGAIISAEPTGNAPFGYWITVNRAGSAATYRPVLRYRSATRYEDGNPLRVIDSEMPAIQQRLGLWRPGRPLPLPPGACAKPQLRKMELWCS
ncbi:MAG: hypothetical protein P0Y59_01905 [Candidatus Sphingomonas phytovorans]|nr:hypothetical protein [Sphingomonas sp.]WEK00471.1 MAG: hypothetical protein P0Y59_01905 [Sphingomonas sp.]